MFVYPKTTTKIAEYRCGGTDSKWSAIKTFRTISNRTDWNPRIVLYGDLGLFNGVSIPRLRDEIEQDQVDLILHVGDFAYDMDTVCIELLSFCLLLIIIINFILS